MASDLAPPAQAQATTPSDAHVSSTSASEPIVNGAHALTDVNGANSGEGLVENAIPLQPAGGMEATTPAQAKPIENVTSGIQPVADFLPKDAPVHSHPTPPPDQPLETNGTSTDVEMTNDTPALPPQTGSSITALPIANESSLIRPREEDDEEEEERSAKRSKVDDANTGREDTVQVPREHNSAVSAQSAPAAAPLPVASTDEEESEIVVSSVAAPKSRATIEVTQPPSTSESPSTRPPEQTATSGSETAPSAPAVKTEAPSDATALSPAVPTEPVTTSSPKYSTAPMTGLQKAFISEKMKNLKKTKHSIAFAKPVDYKALNILAYPEIIKNPMDLGTMEAKLRADQYKSVQDFVNDFDLIIANCRRFNGDAHPVTQAGLSMEAYFRKMMETVPSPDQAPPVKPTKKRSPSIGNKPLPRREARVATTTAPPKTETFALQPDGTPQIRRDSTGRPARAIKPPQSRDLTYAKPKRKEALLELKFCDYVLEELRGPKYDKVNSVFLYPVDPVALNIPHYRQIVKNPMDLSTMGQKLKHGQYARASEFRKDFELMVNNCLTFNPQGNPVRDMGVQFQREFSSLWANKDRWEKANKPEVRAASASADEDSGDEDEDDDMPDDDKEATIQALQKQLLDMQNTIASMANGKALKQKKTKQKTAKKAGTAAGLPKASKSAATRAKPKKPKQVSYEEKQEISEAVGRMSDVQVTKLTQIITENCAKYRDMDEMELEIDDLPNDVQAMLLKYVRSLFGNPNKGRGASPDDGAAMDDDDFEPSARAGGAGGKRKKHKPMGKREQGEAIKNLQSKLAQFNHGRAGSGSESPTNVRQRAADSSSDEESEESEEE